MPFDFTAKPVVVKPARPSKTVRVHAVKERAALEIRFPRIEGYRVELPNERLTAHFNEDSRLELTPELVGPCEVLLEGIVGEGVTLDLKHLGEVRPSSISYHLAKHLLFRKFRDPGEEPKLHLFGQLKQIARRWIDEATWSARAGPSPLSSSTRRSPTKRPTESTSPASVASRARSESRRSPTRTTRRAPRPT